MVEMHSGRSFGLLFAVIFFAIGVWPLAHGQGVHSLWLAAGFVLLFCSLVFPKVLRPFNRIWFRLGLLLHAIVSPLALGVLFFGVFTPYGLAMRMLGKLSLSMHFDRKAKTYWIEKVPPGPAPESFTNQF
jgi:hypothetical protein